MGEFVDAGDGDWFDNLLIAEMIGGEMDDFAVVDVGEG